MLKLFITELIKNNNIFFKTKIIFSIILNLLTQLLIKLNIFLEY